MRTLLLIVPLLTASCARFGPDATRARTWVHQLDPLLDENTLLAEQVLGLASEVYGDSAEAPAIRERWDRIVLPLAFHLRDQAVLVQPPSEWVDEHEGLVETWAARADAYQTLSDAIHEGDPAQWRSGRQALDRAMLDEERWFRETNEVLSPWGLHLDQFP